MARNRYPRHVDGQRRTEHPPRPRRGPLGECGPADRGATTAASSSTDDAAQEEECVEVHHEQQVLHVVATGAGGRARLSAAAISGRKMNIIFGMFSNSARPKDCWSAMILRQASRSRGSYCSSTGPASIMKFSSLQGSAMKRLAAARSAGEARARSASSSRRAVARSLSGMRSITASIRRRASASSVGWAPGAAGAAGAAAARVAATRRPAGRHGSGCWCRPRRVASATSEPGSEIDATTKNTRLSTRYIRNGGV